MACNSCVSNPDHMEFENKTQSFPVWRHAARLSVGENIEKKKFAERGQAVPRHHGPGLHGECQYRHTAPAKVSTGATSKTSDRRLTSSASRLRHRGGVLSPPVARLKTLSSHT